MATKKTTEVETISNNEKIRAAVNLPAGTFVLGDRTFAIKDLPYDDYITFVGYVAPLIDTLVTRVKSQVTVGIPGLDLDTSPLNAHSILTLCQGALPKMVQIMCKQTDPTITEEQVKSLAARPTVLANAVMLQMNQNGIIKDFVDFFGQMVKMLVSSRLTA